MHMWSPFVIKVVLHHYASPAPFPGDGAPIYPKTVADLVNSGILVESEAGSITTTDLGNALVKMWCETPLPVQQWIDPRFSEVQA